MTKATCVVCGVERSVKNLTNPYRERWRGYEPIYIKIDNVYICSSLGTCKANRKGRKGGTKE